MKSLLCVLLFAVGALAWSVAQIVVTDYKDANGQTIRPSGELSVPYHPLKVGDIEYTFTFIAHADGTIDTLRNVKYIVSIPADSCNVIQDRNSNFIIGTLQDTSCHK